MIHFWLYLVSYHLVFSAIQGNTDDVSKQRSKVVRLKHIFRPKTLKQTGVVDQSGQLVFSKLKRPVQDVQIYRADYDQFVLVTDAQQAQHEALNEAFTIQPITQQQSTAKSSKKSQKSSGALKRKITSRLYPDPHDIDMVINLAKMSNNAYNEVNSSTWWDIDGHKAKVSFGRDSTGLRGYVYASNDESLIIMAIKGTSTKFFGFGGGRTGIRDKYHDNLMFSCCCAAVDWTWTPICPCSTMNLLCDSKCMHDSVDQPDSYYNMAREIYDILVVMYPQASIWLTGHSLGGAVAAVTAQSLGIPAVTFEAPGDRLYAEKLGIVHDTISSNGRKSHQLNGKNSVKLQSKSGQSIETEVAIWQFGLPSDPLFTGKCNGAYSLCYANGYAMETKCHLGNVCMIQDSIANGTLVDFLSIKKDGGGYNNDDDDGHDDGSDVPSNLRTHLIKYVIQVLEYGKSRDKQVIADCHTETRQNCRDCEDWIFG
ncbi:hypothetical protein MIR68_001778 [Amoeboaphelidium protococcarum]|nr:hypothetical protein MIR68_001778 [Amoeboaphelidium protococcarum]